MADLFTADNTVPLPGVWRFLEKKESTAPYVIALPNNTNWQTLLTSSTFTITHNSKIRITVTGEVQGYVTGHHHYEERVYCLGDPTIFPASHNLRIIEVYFHNTYDTLAFSDTYQTITLIPGNYQFVYQVKETERTAQTRRVWRPDMVMDISKV